MKKWIVWGVLWPLSGAEAFHELVPRRQRAVALSRSLNSAFNGYYMDIRTNLPSSSLTGSSLDEKLDQEDNRQPPALEWVSIGISTVYLAHFASLYTQLPGLFGQTGLLPIAQRVADLDNLWVLRPVFQSMPELGMEILAVLGIVVSACQLIWGRRLRHGPVGVMTYALSWACWHDLVFAGGRFMQYQMDMLLLDAAPLTLLAASGLVPGAAIFGYRWLLSRVYIGAGAVKLLSCDSSWRDLSAVHWHLQSQPLPNGVGAWAFLHLPTTASDALTWITLVVEMAAPFLFLAPSPLIRRAVFVVHVSLMCGIAVFGNFGPLQILLIILGFALLEDLPAVEKPVLVVDDGSSERRLKPRKTDSKLLQEASVILSLVSLVLAAGGAYWAIGNIGATCLNTLAIEPVVYGLVAFGASTALLPLLTYSIGDVATALTSIFIFLGSASVMAGPLGATVPAFDFLNFGAVPYGLFATITGVNGRPVAAIEAAESADGPWKYIPLLYQVNEPSASLPFILPHFPRVDWTLWFVPFGEAGAWIARFFQGITVSDPAILHLIDESTFHRTFPDNPPAIVRVVPKIYELDPVRRTWSARDDPRYIESPVLATYSRGDINPGTGIASPWPSTPIVRPLASSMRPDFFVWGCLGAAAFSRRIFRLFV